MYSKTSRKYPIATISLSNLEFYVFLLQTIYNYFISSSGSHFNTRLCMCYERRSADIIECSTWIERWFLSYSCHVKHHNPYRQMRLPYIIILEPHNWHKFRQMSLLMQSYIATRYNFFLDKCAVTNLMIVGQILPGVDQGITSKLMIVRPTGKPIFRIIR